MKNPLAIRKAKLADIATLITHRRLMFEEMWRVDGKKIIPEEMEEMSVAYNDSLRAGLKDGTLSAWVVEKENQTVASGALSIIKWPPVPGNCSGKRALLHSLYVDEEHRHSGIAQQIMQSMIDYCRLNNLRSVALNASSAGRGLYESLGFKIDDGAMKLHL